MIEIRLRVNGTWVVARFYDEDEGNIRDIRVTDVESNPVGAEERRRAIEALAKKISEVRRYLWYVELGH